MATKIPGFVGESTTNSLPSHFHQAGSASIGYAAAGQPQHFGYSRPRYVNHSRQLPTPLPLRSQAVPVLLSQDPNRVESGFKSPGLPASVLLRSMAHQDSRHPPQGRRNSLLSNQIYPAVTSSPEQASAMAYASPISFSSPFRTHSSQSPSPSAGSISCRFPSSYSSSRLTEMEANLPLNRSFKPRCIWITIAIRIQRSDLDDISSFIRTATIASSISRISPQPDWTRTSTITTSISIPQHTAVSPISSSPTKFHHVSSLTTISQQPSQWQLRVERRGQGEGNLPNPRLRSFLQGLEGSHAHPSNRAS